MTAQLGGRYAPVVNALRTGEMFGLVDMHMHPAAHLGFGTQLFYGAPDGDPSTTMQNCNPFHGGVDFITNPRGNEWRRILVDRIRDEGGPAWDHKRDGWPFFPAWPSWHDRLHQQVRVEWLERAWRGGLRVAVMLAVNSHVLADAAETQGPYDDRSSADAQLVELTAMVGRHDFMQVARAPGDLRGIVGSGRLAVVLGVELDGLGNFYQPVNTQNSAAPFRPNPTFAEVSAELDRLFNIGVRYVFPIHLTDNVFGGAALYKAIFNTGNRYSFGRHFAAEPAPPDSHIDYVHTNDRDLLLRLGEWVTLGFDPLADFPQPPTTSTGHRNQRGLTPLGEHAIRHLMALGMMIDIDHMSERTAARVLEIAEEMRYPLAAGHTGLRRSPSSERHHQAETLRRLYALGGLAGVGLAEGIDAVSSQIRQIRTEIPGARVALGSDASGLEHLPHPVAIPAVPINQPQPNPPPFVVYADQPGAPAGSLQRCTFGNRAWDFVREGMPHIGLLPDMVEHMYASDRLTNAELADWFHSAEHFARMWEVAASRARLRQNRWAWCQACSGLWFTGNNIRGLCPADAGGHRLDGSGDYQLKFAAAGGAGQDGWRWCARCQGLAFAGNPGTGFCPAGVGHLLSSSGAYRLEDIDHLDRPGGQNQWRWCVKCAGLFFDGNSPGASGCCPADRAFHSGAGSGDYVLRQI